MISWRKQDVEWRIEYRQDASISGGCYDYRIFNHRGKKVKELHFFTYGNSSPESKAREVLDTAREEWQTNEKTKTPAGWKVLT